MDILNGISKGLESLMGGDPEKKKPYDFDTELKKSYLTKLRYDNDRTTKDVVLSAAKKGGIDPAFLLSSAWQEGLNKAALKPDEVSEAYVNASAKGGFEDFPVDGFYNYGVDTFGNRYEELKKYLPEGFDQRFKLYGAKNERGEDIQTAAFKTNEDALIAKSAFLRSEMDNINSIAKEKGIPLDQKASEYLTLAAYNAGPGRAKQLLDEYALAKDKTEFIDKGLTSLKGVHKNIYPRLQRIKLANELLTRDDTLPLLSSPQQAVTTK